MANPISAAPAARAAKKPRDAASLIIYRPSHGGLEVLLGKRHVRARFAPDVYVFPGGAVDRSDYSETPAPVPCAGHMGVGNRPALAAALQMAALREAREETGLVLKNPSAVPVLRYIGRAITPVFSPVRYHARFFSAPADLFEGELAGDGELAHLHWVALERALTYPLIDVTTFMLKELARPCPSAMVPDGSDVRYPLFTYHGKVPRVLYRPPKP